MGLADDIRARLERIAVEDAALNSFVRLDRDQALSTARALEHAAPRGPLHGLTVGVKDNLAVAGQTWTGGLEGRRDIVAAQDAGTVTRLRAAGAILLGGLNMHEAALGATTDNAAFGRCGNPLAPGLTPGGSSGGSAAAVAAGFVDLSLGSDTMGSVRLPAAYCGVAGIKPTFGLIGRSGHLFLAPSLDTIGPLARDPALLWPAVKALADYDPLDAQSLAAPAGWYDRPACSNLTGLRFGVPHQIEAVECERAILDGLQIARGKIADLGGTVVDVDLSGWDPGPARRAGLIVIEAEGAVELADLMNRPGAMTPSLRKMLEFGRDMPAQKLVQALSLVRAAGAACHRALASVDAVLMPTAPQRAVAHGAPVPHNQADLTALANFAGCPALSLPVDLGQAALPASIQIVAAPWCEAALTLWGEMLAPALFGPPQS